MQQKKHEWKKKNRPDHQEDLYLYSMMQYFRNNLFRSDLFLCQVHLNILLTCVFWNWGWRGNGGAIFPVSLSVKGNWSSWWSVPWRRVWTAGSIKETLSGERSSPDLQGIFCVHIYFLHFHYNLGMNSWNKPCLEWKKVIFQWQTIVMVICNIYYHISPQKTVKVFLLVYQHHFVNCLQSLIVFNAKKKNNSRL